VNPALAHLVVVPVILPLLVAALLALIGDRHRRLASLINIGASGTGLLVALAILARVDADGVPGAIGVYLAANWEAPFGIVLVADRLSALMLVLTGVVGLAGAVYATAAWSRAGVFFHPLFQIQLMGLNGAFLTADLFNLFVFFEVMLAAYRGEPARVVAVLGGAGDDLWRHGDPVDGRRRREAAARAGGRSRPAPCRRGHFRRGVPDESGDLAAQLLARSRLSGGERAGGSALCADD
jgi:hypothetical protein